MTDQLWPAAAREAVLKALYAHPHGDSVTTDAVLAALADHAVPRAEHERRCDELDAAGMAIAAAHSRLHQAVLDLAQQWEPGMMLNTSDHSTRYAVQRRCAAELRALVGVDQ